MSLQSLFNHWGAKEYSDICYDKLSHLEKRIVFLSEEESNSLLYELNLISHDKASQSNIKKWDIGWGQNLSMLSGGYDPRIALTPCYFGKYPGGRIMGRFYYDKLTTNYNDLLKKIRSPEYNITQEIRYKSLENELYRAMLEQLIFKRILKYCKRKNLAKVKIIDLGAGSCHNIIHLSQFLIANNIEPKIYASDWSASTRLIVESLNKQKFINDATFISVNYFDSNTFANIASIKPDILYSVASLEQFPGNPDQLLSAILDAGTKLCIHIEPIKESLSQDDTNDMQSINYMNRRNYLNNIIGAMLTIDMACKYSLSTSIYRTGLGSIFLDGYTQLSYERND